MGQICCSGEQSSIDQNFSRKNFVGVRTSSILKDYDFQQLLGYGSFGEVRLANHKRSKVQVAIKKINIDPKDKDQFEMIRNEVEILIKCDHPNIIKIFDAYKEPRYTYIVEEYIPNCQTIGTLFENETEFNEANRAFVINQILRALNYMHSNNLVHRDLKPDNVIYSPQENSKDFSDIQFKLIDFGFAKTSKQGSLDLDDFVGTPFYLPPEIVNDERYGSGCDIWSLGVLTYFIIENNYPFKADKRKELFDKIKIGQFTFDDQVWNRVSDNCKDFIKQCLTLNQEKRPSASDLLNHPWIKSKPLGFLFKMQDQQKLTQVIKSNVNVLSKMNNFQWSVMSYMNQLNLYQTEMSDLRKLFESVDKNNDGTLTLDEIRDIMVLHLSSEDYEEFSKLLKTIDRDNSGQIDYSEFINLTIEKKKLLSRDNLAITFRTLDLDNNGSLTIDELKQAFDAGQTKKNQKFWQDFMESIDENKDNVISLDEFEMISCTIKWLSFFMTAYIYYQNFLVFKHTYKFNCSLQGFCSKHEQKEREDNFQEYFDKLVLTEEDEAIVLKKYAQIEKSINVSPDCAIGVGYTTCMDIGFRAVDLFKALEGPIDKMAKQGRIVPQVHEKISELREFVETFLYYFSQGANAERVSDSKDIFYLFYDTIKQNNINHKDELGGHSSVFALRAQREQCKVFIAAQASDFNLKTIPLNQQRAKDFLVWPQSQQQLTAEQKEKNKKSYDIHLVFEYNEGDVILGFSAPRSNRFYFVHDPNGAYFKQMEVYHETVENHPEILRHMFGGYQLMQKLNINEVELRMKQLDTLWKKLKSQNDHRIHVEFAHFSRLDFFKVFEHYVDINAARESKPSLEEILEQLKKFFKVVKEENLSISRVHMHPYGSFILCYDHNKWEDGYNSIIKSSLSTPKYCMQADDMGEHIENYDIPERPEQFANPQNFGDVIKVDKHNLTYNFNLSDDITCYLQFFIKCRKMVKTAGMGDTISSTGFIYQAPNVHEPRRTFTAASNDYLSKTQYRGGAVHTTHYQTNGGGRDSYIVRDNGGFCKMSEPCQYPGVGTFSPKRRAKGNAPIIHAKNLFYRSDGTGRDAYIVTTSGGFNNPGKVVEFRQAFVASLRQYERPNSAYTKLGGMTGGMKRTASTNTFKHAAESHQEIKKRDYLVESQLTFNWKFHEEQNNLRKSQKFMDDRLAQPKRVRSKMPINSKTIEY